MAPLRLTQLVAPSMRKRKWGRIVFVSSAAPLRGIANYAPYVSARAGMDVLVLERFVLLKKEQPNAGEIDNSAYLAQFALD